jgi:hypothetical protein
MAYKRVSELDEASSVQATDLMEISQDLGGGSYLSKKVTKANVIGGLNLSDIVFVVDGGTSVITTGDKAWVRIPYNGIISGWEITSDLTGNCIVTVSRSTYATYPSFSAISGTEKPTLMSSQKNKDSSLTTWTTALAVDDYLRISVDSVTNIKRLIVSILVSKT